MPETKKKAAKKAGAGRTMTFETTTKTAGFKAWVGRPSNAELHDKSIKDQYDAYVAFKNQPKKPRGSSKSRGLGPWDAKINATLNNQRKAFEKLAKEGQEEIETKVSAFRVDLEKKLEEKLTKQFE